MDFSWRQKTQTRDRRIRRSWNDSKDWHASLGLSGAARIQWEAWLYSWGITTCVKQATRLATVVLEDYFSRMVRSHLQISLEVLNLFYDSRESLKSVFSVQLGIVITQLGVETVSRRKWWSLSKVPDADRLAPLWQRSSALKNKYRSREILVIYAGSILTADLRTNLPKSQAGWSIGFC